MGPEAIRVGVTFLATAHPYQAGNHGQDKSPNRASVLICKVTQIKVSSPIRAAVRIEPVRVYLGPSTVPGTWKHFKNHKTPIQQPVTSGRVSQGAGAGLGLAIRDPALKSWVLKCFPKFTQS